MSAKHLEEPKGTGLLFCLFNLRSENIWGRKVCINELSSPTWGLLHKLFYL